MRCFVDANGHLWSINHAGESNFPGDILITSDTVQVLGPHDDMGPGREVAEEYVLWPSLTSLSEAIEKV